jgi:tRNA/rRNA methyltransferase
MSNFGFLELSLVGAYELAYREARSAVGAAGVLKTAREHETVGEAVSDCTLVIGTTAARSRQLELALRRLDSGARLIRQHSGRVALLFGSEKFGLSNDDMSHCHWLIQIPTRDEHRSMNLGQAVAVVLYELSRPSRATAKLPVARRRASAEQSERVTSEFLEALRRSGYVNPRTAGSTENKVRRLVRRLNLNARDADVLLGMLRQVLWKLGR